MFQSIIIRCVHISCLVWRLWSYGRPPTITSCSSDVPGREGAAVRVGCDELGAVELVGRTRVCAVSSSLPDSDLPPRGCAATRRLRLRLFGETLGDGHGLVSGDRVVIFWDRKPASSCTFVSFPSSSLNKIVDSSSPGAIVLEDESATCSAT